MLSYVLLSFAITLGRKAGFSICRDRKRSSRDRFSACRYLCRAFSRLKFRVNCCKRMLFPENKTLESLRLDAKWEATHRIGRFGTPCGLRKANPHMRAHRSQPKSRKWFVFHETLSPPCAGRKKGRQRRASSSFRAGAVLRRIRHTPRYKHAVCGCAWKPLLDDPLHVLDDPLHGFCSGCPCAHMVEYPHTRRGRFYKLIVNIIILSNLRHAGELRRRLPPRGQVLGSCWHFGGRNRAALIAAGAEPDFLLSELRGLDLRRAEQRPGFLRRRARQWHIDDHGRQSRRFL